MSESWSEIGRNEDESGQGGTAWSTNGKGLAEPSEADEPSEHGGSVVAVSDPEPVSGAHPETAPADDDSAAVAAAQPVAGDPSTSFLTELARAMRATANQERERIVADIDKRRSARVEEIRAREAAEAERMRELAAEDQAAIDTWAETEIARIKSEQERRADALRADLETSLGQHRELIAQEIERVESAVATYRIELAAFFEALNHETDPVAIAQLATHRPEFPSLDTVPLVAEEPVAVADPIATDIGAAETQPEPDTETLVEVSVLAPDDEGDDEALVAEATATEDEVAAFVEPERPLVGVMDYAPDPFGDPWRDLPEKTGSAEDESGDPHARASGQPQGEVAEPDAEVPDGVVVSAPRGRSVLQAVPALRPMGSWLGRHANSDQPDIHS